MVCTSIAEKLSASTSSNQLAFPPLLKGVWENTSWVRTWAAFICGGIRYWCFILSHISNGYVADGISDYGVLGIWGFGFSKDVVLSNFGSGPSYYGSVLISLGFGHIIVSGTGF
ncbi:hypothetical protein Tco_1319107 [Tanacetum coccineum]